METYNGCPHPEVKKGKAMTNPGLRAENFYCLACGEDITNEKQAERDYFDWSDHERDMAEAPF